MQTVLPPGLDSSSVRTPLPRGADAGADDAGAKGPPWRGGHNACKRTECCKKASQRGRRTRPRPVAMRPRHGPPRTGGPDRCVRVVKESHERRVPVSRLLVRSDRRSRKTPHYRPSGRERTDYPKSADRRDRLYVWTERMREIRCGAADGPPTVSPSGRRGNAVPAARSSGSWLRRGNHKPKRPTPG